MVQFLKINTYLDIQRHYGMFNGDAEVDRTVTRNDRDAGIGQPVS